MSSIPFASCHLKRSMVGMFPAVMLSVGLLFGNVFVATPAQGAEQTKTRKAHPPKKPKLQKAKIKPPAPRPHIIVPKNSTTTTQFVPIWTISRLCEAYNFPTNLTANTNGVIGILEFGGGWLQSDLDKYCELNGFPKISVTDVSLDGTKNTPGTALLPSQATYEVNLDIQVAATAYYYATGKMPQVYVFFSSPDDYVTAPGVLSSVQAFTQTFQAAVKYKCNVLSISWGAPEVYYRQVAFFTGKPNLYPLAIAEIEAAAVTACSQGLTIFASSGDYSSGDGYVRNNVDVPACCPHVVACGGTSKPATGTSPPTLESAWGDGFRYDSGSGGGFSRVFGPMSYQKGVPAPNNPFTTLYYYGSLYTYSPYYYYYYGYYPGYTGVTLGRMVPDVSACADPNTGVGIVVYGTEGQVGGTSGVSPLYAGLFCALGKNLGWVTPTLYNNQWMFNDITVGSNGGFSAGVGPDPVTGIGTPNGASLAQIFSGKALPAASVVTASATTNKTSGVTTVTITGDNNPNSISLTYTPTKIAGQIVSATLTVAGVNSSTTVNGAASVTYSVGPLPFVLNMTLGNGDDTVNCNALMTSTTTITVGTGADVINLNYCTVNTQLTITGNGGFDVVSIIGCSIKKQTLTNVFPNYPY